MDHNHHWYQQQSTPTHPQHARQQYQYPQDQQPSGMAADSVQDAQTLLAGYPMASATPTTHVARHLSNLAVTAPPASYAQPSYYSVQHNTPPQGNPPPYTEYAQELSYLAAPTVPSGDNGYWESMRNEAVRLLGDPSTHHYSPSNYPPVQQWSQQTSSHSHYHPSAFGQSILQRVYPPSSYPASSPPVNSSSSSTLAFALGPPPTSQSQPPSQQYTYPQPSHQAQVAQPSQSQVYAAPPASLTPSTPQRSYQTPQHPQHTQAQPASAQYSSDQPRAQSAQPTRESVQLPPIRNYPTPRQQGPAVEPPPLKQAPSREPSSANQLPPLRFLPPQTPNGTPSSYRTPQHQPPAQRYAHSQNQTTPQPAHSHRAPAEAGQMTYQRRSSPQSIQQGSQPTHHSQQSPAPLPPQHSPHATEVPQNYTAQPQVHYPPQPQSHYVSPSNSHVSLHPPQSIHHQTNYQFSFHYPPPPQSQVQFHHAHQQQQHQAHYSHSHPHSYRQAPHPHQYQHASYYAQPQYQQHPAHPRRVYRPEESSAFFNEFLEHKTREMTLHDARYRQGSTGPVGVQTPQQNREFEQGSRSSGSASSSTAVNGQGGVGSGAGGDVTPKGAQTPIVTPRASAVQLPRIDGGKSEVAPMTLDPRQEQPRLNVDAMSLDSSALETQESRSETTRIGSIADGDNKGSGGSKEMSADTVVTTPATTPTPTPSSSPLSSLPSSAAAASRKRKPIVQIQSVSKKRAVEQVELETVLLSQSSGSILPSLSSSSPVRPINADADAKASTATRAGVGMNGMLTTYRSKSSQSQNASDSGSMASLGLGSPSSKSVASSASGASGESKKRIVNKAYVAVPYKPWLTNSSHSDSSSSSLLRKEKDVVVYRRRQQDQQQAQVGHDESRNRKLKRGYDGLGIEEDLSYKDDAKDGDYSEYDESPTKRASKGKMFGSTPRAEPVSGGNVAIGVDHGPLSKFTSLLEDIFEAEDTLPAELSPSDLEDSEFFSGLSPDGSQPLLHPNVIRKLTKMIEQIARPTKRMRQAAAAAGNRIVSGGGIGAGGGVMDSASKVIATPKVMSIGRMSNVDTTMIGRVLKLLERSVKLGEDLDPFVGSMRSGGGESGGVGGDNGSVPGSLLSVPQPPKSPRKRRAAAGGKGKKGEAKGKTGRDGEGEEDGRSEVVDEDERASQAGGAVDVKESDLEGLTKTFDVARDSVLAADCIIGLLGSDRLTKQLYSEELITTCLGTIKNQLTKLIYPFIENSTPDAFMYGSANYSALLRYLVLAKGSSPSSNNTKNLGSTVESHRKQLGEVFQILSGVLFKITKLVDAESVAMSDSIIIQSVFIAIGPFFVVEPTEGGGGDGTGAGGEGKTGIGADKKRKDGNAGNAVVKTFGKSAMRGLRLETLSLIRIIFANHENQRSWIIEEILTSLIKLSDTKQKAGQFKLRDGRSIKTVSALLLQLVQTSAHDIRIEARKIQKARQDKFALKRQESIVDSQGRNRKASESFLDDSDHDEIRLYGSGLESATKAAKTIILFLTQRSGRGKLTKNSNEAEYRTIFDNLMSDLLVVHNWPEWPAANLLLSIASKFMVSSLDDVKSTNQTDNNAARTMALDHLGVIAAHMRTSALKVQQQGVEGGFRGLKPLDELVSTGDLKGLEKLLTAHRDLATHLCRRAHEDQAYDSARELTAVTLGQELASAIRTINMRIDGEDDDDNASSVKDPSKLLALGKKLKASLGDIWKDPGVDVFDSLQDDVGSVDRLAEEIGTIQSMRSSFQPILGVILMALDAPPIFMRTKALRALGQIVTSDATILSATNVRRAIESHLLDSSPAVRDAAVELIGKYMIDAPEVAGNYYQKIADRIADTGLAVRKRVIKLLKSYYTVTDSTTHRIDISTRMVLRMLDEDDTVKDLAVKNLEELWFPNMTTGPNTATTRHRGGQLASVTQSDDKMGLQGKVAVIMGTAANFKDRQSPLEEMLRKIIFEKSEAEVAALHARYEEICETLIDGLVDASDLPGFTVINCIRTIYLLASAYPSILSGSRASTLLPYLKNASTPEEQTTSDYLLKIFKASIPHMPKTAAKFGQELQAALQPMIIKPSGGSLQVLQETVACLCAVVQSLTHDFSRLINLVKSCNLRLQDAINKKQTLEAKEIRSLCILIFILALLGQHCDFDKLRSENDTPGLTAEINVISRGPIIEHLYDSLLKLYNKFDIPSLRGRILQCLGFLFRAQPTLMTEERSATIMDSIFASSEEEGHGRVLKIIQEFLISEAEKHAAKEKDKMKAKGKQVEVNVNMEELVGNTEGFADSGVSSAVVQRYINPIIAAALSQNVQIQAAAVDILTFTVKQGLTHPLQSFPVIVALETSPSPTLSNRASALHSILHGKHSSLLNARFTASARSSFDYQKKIASGPVHGFRVQGSIPVAMLQRWYSLVREKRPSRQDFLKAMVKVFEENPAYQSSQDDVDFTRYMAENFSAFEYKTQEEVLTVIKHLTRILSTTGMQLLELVSPSHLLAQLRSNSSTTVDPNTDGDAMNVDNFNVQNKGSELDKIPLMRTSVIIAMVMLLKAHLKALYSLSEDKCNKFVIGKKSAIGDRPATKRHDNPISWERLPYATAPILTSEDVTLQRTRFLDIWNEDGVTAEPEDEIA
ncbi:hypothetical protein AX16_006108 [Volvariella volvacea WC 439]|nr:hypothetical protein AX16_006108 [Volvariella volvacea WC 439]